MKIQPLALSITATLGVAVLAWCVHQSHVLAAEPQKSDEASEEAADKAPPGPSVDDAALNRTRKVTKTLDEIYKQVIVLITDKYVHDEGDFAAGSAAVLLFETISDSGSHQVRLIDATGEPYDTDNEPQDDFEKEGIKQLKAGKDRVERVVEKEGEKYLRTLTPVPVVMEKCVMCHSHYEDAEEGEPIGAIGYMVPIE